MKRPRVFDTRLEDPDRPECGPLVAVARLTRATDALEFPVPLWTLNR